MPLTSTIADVICTPGKTQLKMPVCNISLIPVLLVKPCNWLVKLINCEIVDFYYMLISGAFMYDHIRSAVWLYTEEWNGRPFEEFMFGSG